MSNDAITIRGWWRKNVADCRCFFREQLRALSLTKTYFTRNTAGLRTAFLWYHSVSHSTTVFTLASVDATRALVSDAAPFITLIRFGLAAFGRLDISRRQPCRINWMMNRFLCKHHAEYAKRKVGACFLPNGVNFSTWAIRELPKSHVRLCQGNLRISQRRRWPSFSETDDHGCNTDNNWRVSA